MAHARSRRSRRRSGPRHLGVIALATRTRWVRISRTILIDLLNVLLDLVFRDTLLEDDDVLCDNQ